MRHCAWRRCRACDHDQSVISSRTGSSQTVCQMPVTAVYQMLVRLEHLLAARLRPLVGRIPDATRTSSWSPLPLERVGDVDGERIVAAAMLAQLHAVDADGRLPVDGAEVEQQPTRRAAARARGTCDDTRVAVNRSRRVPRRSAATAPETGRGSCRPTCRLGGIRRGDRVVPPAVEVGPARAHHLRAADTRAADDRR